MSFSDNKTINQKKIKEEPDPNDKNKVNLFNKKRTCPASITIEAALVLPISMFAIFIMLLPLRAIDAERILQNKMESVSKDLAKGAYVKETVLKQLEIKESEDSEEEGSAQELISNLSDGAVLLSVSPAIDESVMKNIRFDESTEILSDKETADPAMIYMKLRYELKIPVSVFSLLPVEREIVVNRRAWVGADGGRGRNQYGTDTDKELSKDDAENDIIVYIGKGSTRYHLDPHCHYLDNKTSTADVSEMENLRNDSGGKYHACPRCNPGNSGTVYYFKSGTAYHSDPECKAITAYVSEVKLSEVEYMGVCSYCGKQH